MDSISKIKQIVKRVKELGQPAFALTDHGTMSGTIEAYKVAKENGVKFIFGCEVYFTPDTTIKDRSLSYHLILLAKNDIGYKNLKKLVTIASLPENFYYTMRVDWDMLDKYGEGLIVTSACLGGILNSDNAEHWARKFKERFGQDYFIELHTYQTQQQFDYNRKIIEIAKKYDIQPLAATDSHYILKEDANTHRKFLGIKGETYYDTDDFYLMSEEDVRERLRYLPQNIVDTAIANTVLISDMCNVDIEFGGHHYPVFSIEDKRNAFFNLCRRGLNRILNPGVEYEERLNHEIDILDKADYINYFFICHDLVTWAKSQGIRVGPGRGSVVASLCSYLCGITQLDPLKFGLIFERFCNLERVTPADVDLDFQKSRRGEVIEYLRQKYGQVCQVRNFSFMGAKAALKRAGQALNIDPQYINNLSKRIGLDDDDGEEYKGDEIHLHALDLIDSEQDHEVVDLAKKFVGVIQSFGVHASAVIIFAEDPNSFCALEHSKDGLVVNIDYHDIEEMGVLKQDILGLRTLDVVDEVVKETGCDIDNIKWDDVKTSNMLCKGYTKGCFQIESPGMTKLVKDIQPQGLHDLVPLVALYRPGPLDSGMVKHFVERRAGREEITYLHPKLEPVLKNTYGIILYQEQIQRIARDLCGYTLGEGDNLRRIIGRKKVEEMDDAITKFIEAGTKNGIDTIKEISDQVVTFANYGFNMGHSAAYGYLAYQTAYLKAHYPRQYIAALINSKMGKIEQTTKYIQEARNIHINVLPPHIMESKYKCYVDGKDIVLGFGCIKDVGNARFIPDPDFVTFLHKNKKLNKKVTTALIKSGCFGYNNIGKQLSQLQWWKEYYPRIEECKAKIIANKDNEKRLNEWKEKLKQVPPITDVIPIDIDEGQAQREVIGVTFISDLDKYDLDLCNNQNIIGGKVVNIRPWKTKNGDNMKFVTVDTGQRDMDLVIFAPLVDKVEINEGTVYLFKLNYKNVILDIATAGLKKHYRKPF